MTSPSTISTRFPRPQRTAVLLGMRPLQVSLSAVAVLLLALTAFGGGSAIARLGGLLIAAAAVAIAFARIDGLLAYHWIVLATLHAIRGVRGKQRHRARLPEPKVHGALHLPGQETALRVMETNGPIAAVLDPRRRRLVAVARIEGPAHLLQNSDEQEHRGLTPGSWTRWVDYAADGSVAG